MKTTLLSAAMIAVLATACTRTEPADTAADTTPAADAPAVDPMASTPPATDPATTAPATPAPAADVTAIAVGSADHSTLVSALQAAGLVETLQGAGPFTVFAPTNAAFTALPAGTVDGLLKPEAKADLTKVLTYHVVPGNLDAAELTRQIQAGNGQATLTTVQGATLTAKAGGPGGVTITDAKGNVANVTTADLKAGNGVVHVIDKVVMAN